MILDNNGNRHRGEFNLSLFTMNSISIDDLIRKNFRRIIDLHDIQQNKLADSIGVAPAVINDILAGRKPMGKDTMGRICKALKIAPWEFYWTERAPLVKDDHEQQALDRFRREQMAGVAEDVAKYGEYRIEEAKKKEGPGSEGKAGEVPRRRHKRAG